MEHGARSSYYISYNSVQATKCFTAKIATTPVKELTPWRRRHTQLPCVLPRYKSNGMLSNCGQHSSNQRVTTPEHASNQMEHGVRYNWPSNGQLFLGQPKYKAMMSHLRPKETPPWKRKVSRWSSELRAIDLVRVSYSMAYHSTRATKC